MKHPRTFLLDRKKKKRKRVFEAFMVGMEMKVGGRGGGRSGRSGKRGGSSGEGRDRGMGGEFFFFEDKGDRSWLLVKKNTGY